MSWSSAPARSAATSAGGCSQAGVAEEVAFLVRPGRKAQLDRDGLAIESPAGDFRRHPVRALLAGEAGPDWDVVLLTCKAYDLDAAIEALRPAMDARTAVLPLLNGISHLERLEAAFGPRTRARRADQGCHPADARGRGAAVRPAAVDRVR